MTEPLITQTNLPPGLIDLGLGNPDLSLLPLDLLRQSAEAYFLTNDPRPLQYGIEQGNGYFRHALADFLTKGYGKSVDPDLLFVTTGASSALDLICSLYTHPEDVIFVEEPSYFLALRIFADRGLRIIPVPMNKDGLDVKALAELCLKHAPKLVYTIPTFQNPSGLTLSQSRREKLVELAQQHNFLIVADEVYQFLAYTQAPPAPFATFAEEMAQVISINSFSKILAPGLRLGWIQAHPLVIKRLSGCGLLDSGGGMNPFTSALIRSLIESGGLRENIARLSAEYAHRLDTLDKAIRTHLPEADYTRPKGGFFFWVRLPDVDTVELRSRAKKHGLDFRPGTLFSSCGGMQDYIRMSFCYYGPADIEKGIRRLGNVLAR